MEETANDYLIKLSNEPVIKANGTQWEEHILTWLPPTTRFSYLYTDSVAYYKMENGKVSKQNDIIGFLGLAEMLDYFKNYDNGMHKQLKEFFKVD